MNWNYRVWKDVFDGEDFFSIKETYYNDAGEITACTTDAVNPSGGTFLELDEDLQHFLGAMCKPVLVTDGFVFAQDADL